MKKLCSLVCAAAVALSLTVPVFAQGTPGEVATDLAQIVYDAPWETDTAKQMVDLVQQNSNLYVNTLIGNAGIRAIATANQQFGTGYCKVSHNIDDIGIWALINLRMEKTDGENNSGSKVELKKTSDIGFELNVEFEKEPELGAYLFIDVHSDAALFKEGSYVGFSTKGQTLESGAYSYKDPQEDWGSGFKQQSSGRFWIPGSGTYTFTHVDALEPTPTATPAPTAQPTATPAPSAQPTATPAPTNAPVPTATPVPGTPGEITGDEADQLLKDPSNTQLANEIVTQINYERYMNVTSKVANAVANAIQYNPMNLGAAKDGIQFGATLHKDNSGFVLVPESAAIEGDRAQVSLHFEDANGNTAQPKLGGLVTVKISGKTMPAGDYVLVGEGNRMIDSVTVTTVGNDTVISFWAPHFSTYAIVPRSAYVAPSDNNNGGSTAVNPIKATGLDMSMALMGVVAMAGVAVVGGAVIAKKAKKD